MESKALLLFDGSCSFCTRFAWFCAKRDKKNMFRFASLKSKEAKATLKAFRVVPTPKLDTAMLIQDGKCYFRSAAVLRTLKELSFPWNMFSVFLIFPRIMRDPAYMLFAHFRHKLFSCQKTCPLPPSEIRKKFYLEEEQTLEEKCGHQI